MLSKQSNRKTGAKSPWDSDPFLWEPLEQRLLLSADSAGAIIGDGAVLSILDREQQEDAVDLEALVSFLDREPAAESAQDRSPTPLPNAVNLESLAGLTAANAPVEPAADALLAWLSDADADGGAVPDADETGQRHEILFVDTRTPDYQQLLDGIARGSADTNIEIVLLDPDRDGIRQVSDSLTGHTAVDAVHIVSHGDAGKVQLGNGWLSQDNLAGYVSAIEGWSEVLTTEADLLFYGCNLAASDEGRGLIGSLGEITGADVAASDDLTGNRLLGGDWDLEYRLGSIQTAGIAPQELQQEWSGLLAGAWFDPDDGTPQGGATANGDLYTGDAGNDTGILGGSGSDVLYGRDGDDQLEGGTNDDLLIGGPGNDTLLGGSGVDLLYGGPGDDQLEGGNDDDVLVGGGGNDNMDGALHNDLFLFSGARDGDLYTVDGGQHADTIDLTEFGPGSVTIVDPTTLTVDLGGGQSFTVNHADVENIVTADTGGNHAAHADAGSDQSVTPNASASLNASASYDFDTDPLSYQWYQISGTWVTLSDRNAASPNFSAPAAPDVLEFAVVVDDGTSKQLDIVQIDVGGSNIMVDTGSDISDGDTSSISNLLANKGADGEISLREAIEATNNTVGLDTISFAIPLDDTNHLYYRDDGVAGALSLIETTPLDDASIADFDPDYPYAPHSWFRIDLDNGLPGLEITDPVVIDGYSQNGATSNTLMVGQDVSLKIELTSSGADGNRGLAILPGGAGSTISGLAINGFDGSGILTEPGADGVTIQGNFIGTDITGTLDLGNGDAGVHLRSSNNLVGGPNPADRNVVSGNEARGVTTYTFGPIVTGNVIENNYIGVDATGANGLGNSGEAGVQVYSNDGLQLRDNVISDNSGYGVWLRFSNGVTNTVVTGNLIGTDATGMLDLGNGSHGIFIEGGALDNTIGLPGQGNVIAYSAGDGVCLEDNSTDRNTIRYNSIYANSGLGIDLGVSGYTLNDAGDSDDGPNDLQNYPVLTSATVDNGDLTLTGTLNSTASMTFDIDFYASATADGSGYGEAERYLGSVQVTTDVSGNATINKLLSSTDVVAGEFITATATDSSGNTSEFSLTLTASVENSPVFTAGGPFGLDENSADLTLVGNVDANDGDGGAADAGIGYTITANVDPDGDGTDAFSIDPAGVIRVQDAGDLDYESDTSLTITVQADDGILQSSTDIDINLNPLNDNAPVVTSANTANVAENSTAVHQVTANDADLPGDALSFSIAGTGADDALFGIDAAGNLSFIAAPDYELPTDAGGNNVYQVDVAVFDGTNTTVQRIDITVTKENDNAPVVTSANTANVAENSTAVHQVTANDADLPGDTLSFSIAGTGADDALFGIDAAGNLSFIAAPDYELPTDAGGNNVYQVDVAVFDGVNTTVQRIDVTVTDENDEAPVFTAGGPFGLDENSADLTLVGNVDANDGDGGAADAGIGYTITANVDPDGDGTDAFSIDPAGVIRVQDAGDLDYESDTSLTITVQADDGILQSSTDIDINLNPLNDNAPVVTSANTANVAENSTAVHQVTANDADLPGDALSFSIAGTGADDALFGIDAAGNLSFIAAPDYELPTDAGGNNVYQVDVAVFDGTNTTVQRIDITVTKENDNAPVVTSANTANVAENSTAVHQVTANDADLPGDTLSFSIAGTGADDALFGIDAAGNLSFIAAPDYELPADAGGNNGYQVDVAVFDGVNTTVQRIDVTVTEENDNAPVVTSANTASVAENSTAVHQVTAGDADLPGDTLSFSIAGTGADDALFSIDAAGNLVFVAAPDYELPADAGGDNGYQVDVAVFDGVNTTVQCIDITVTGVNEAPQIDLGIPGNTLSVISGTSQIIDVDATDVDSTGLTYSISGPDAAVLEIDPVTGALSFQSAADHESPVDSDGNNVYTVTVSVSDGTNSVSQPLTVIVAPKPIENGSPSISDIKTDNQITGVDLPSLDRSNEPAEESKAEASDTPAEGSTEETGYAEQPPQERESTSPSGFGSGLILPEKPDTDSDLSEPPLPLKLDNEANTNAPNQPATEWKQSLVNLISGNDPLELLARRGFLDGLDEMRDNAEDRLNLDKAMIGSTVALSTGLSVGYVAWLIRSGALLSGLLTSLPAWQFIDPMPVLAFVKKQPKKDQDDDDSLESMVNTSDEKKAANAREPQPGLPPHEN